MLPRSFRRFVRPRTTLRQFFAQNSPQGFFQPLSSLLFDVLTQGGVNQRLVIAAAGIMDLPTGPFKNGIVEANVIRVLPAGMGTTAPRLPRLKSYSFLIAYPS